MPVKLCLERGCGNVATSRGRCDEHRKLLERNRSRARRDDARDRNRFYARKHWWSVRRHKLAANPICELCNYRLATEVHHRIPLEQGGAEYDPKTWSPPVSPAIAAKRAENSGNGVGEG